MIIITNIEFSIWVSCIKFPMMTEEVEINETVEKDILYIENET